MLQIKKAQIETFKAERPGVTLVKRCPTKCWLRFHLDSAATPPSNTRVMLELPDGSREDSIIGSVPIEKKFEELGIVNYYILDPDDVCRAEDYGMQAKVAGSKAACVKCGVHDVEGDTRSVPDRSLSIVSSSDEELEKQRAEAYVKQYQYTMVGLIPAGSWQIRPRSEQHLEKLKSAPSKDIEIAHLNFGGAIGLSVKPLVFGVRVVSTGVISMYSALGLGIGFDVDFFIRKAVNILKIAVRSVTVTMAYKVGTQVKGTVDKIAFVLGDWKPLEGVQTPITSQALDGAEFQLTEAKSIGVGVSGLEIKAKGGNYKLPAEVGFNLGLSADTTWGQLKLLGTFASPPNIETIPLAGGEA